jgi:hypothetical protein
MIQKIDAHLLCSKGLVPHHLHLKILLADRYYGWKVSNGHLDDNNICDRGSIEAMGRAK